MSDCLFCRIVAGEVPATIVRETPTTLAFRDIAPQAPTHVLVIPREHHDDLAALVEGSPDLAGPLFREAHAVAVAEGLVDSGYRVVVNIGHHGGQAVGHVHVHVLGGRQLGPLG